MSMHCLFSLHFLVHFLNIEIFVPDYSLIYSSNFTEIILNIYRNTKTWLPHTTENK